MRIDKPAWLLAMALLGAFDTGSVEAGMISFTAKIQSNADLFSITNLSTDGITITGLTLQLGDNTEFDTSVLALGAGSDPAGDLAFSPDLGAAIIDGAAATDLTFSGFDFEDVFAIATGFVDRTDGSMAVGPDMDHAYLLVSFSTGQSLTGQFSGGPTSPASSQRQSFTFSQSATASSPAPLALANPEPASAILLVTGFAGSMLFWLRRRLV